MKLAAVGHDDVAGSQISDHQALLLFSYVERNKPTQTCIHTVLILFTWFSKPAGFVDPLNDSFEFAVLECIGCPPADVLPVWQREGLSAVGVAFRHTARWSGIWRRVWECPADRNHRQFRVGFDALRVRQHTGCGN